MAIDTTRLHDPAYIAQLQADEGRDGREFREMIRNGWQPPTAPSASVTGGLDSNRTTQQLSQSQLFSQEQQRIRDWATSQGLNPDSYASLSYLYNPAAIGDSSNVQMLRGISSINPDGSISMDQLRNFYSGSGAEFQGIPFDQWLAGPSSPFKQLADGRVIYDHTKQTEFPSYDPASTGLSGFMEKAIPGLAMGLFGAGALGALTNGAWGLAPGSLGEAGFTDFALNAVSPTQVAGDSAINFAGTAASDPMGAALLNMAQTPSLSVPGVGGVSSGSLASILGGATPVVSGPLGALTLDAVGNIVPQLTNLANSATSLAGGAATPVGGGGLGGGGGGGGSGTNAGNTAGTTVAKTGLSKFLQDNLGVDVDPNTLGLLGNLLGTGLGVYGANQQQESMENLYNRFFDMGAPYRDSLAQLNANPESFYSSPMVQGALQQGSDALARSLSAKVGNPILNPTALQEMQNYTTRGLLDAYGNRWNQLASAGQLGVSQSAPLGVQASNAQGNVYNALGAGLGSVFGNQRDYAGDLLDILRNRNTTGGLV